MYYEEEDWDAPYVPPPANRPVQFYEAPKSDNDNQRRYQNRENQIPQNKGRRNGENNFNRNGVRRNEHNDENRQFQRNYNGFHKNNRGPINQNRRDNGETITMKIPSRFVGKVIGRGGSKISELQSESGARIIVTDDKDGDDTVLKLIGANENVIKARNMIEDIAKDPIRFVNSSIEDYEKPKPVYEQIDWTARFAESDRLNREKFDKLGPIIKKFYVEHPEVARMTDDEVKKFRELNNNIVADRTFKTEQSKPIPKPCVKFEHAFHNFPEILDEIKQAGFEKPSPIQSQAWPVLLSGEDLIGIAQTGTGKTLAFLLPALIHIDGQLKPREERDGPKVLVMAPTRELALQIDKEVKKYHYKGIKAVCLYGGGNRREQVKVVTEGVDIIIATPGRLNDLVAAGHVNLESLTYAVLDEADRMLDMGFEPQIRKIMYSINPSRQTIMTSATWPHGVRKLAESYMEDPVQVYVGSLDLAATHSVTQTIVLVEDDDKFDMFLEFARNMDPTDKVIAFCGKKATADDVASDLALQGIPCQTLHGDREQCDREQALQDITDGTIQILIATDVASRGLDINDITHVLNYDFPRNIEEYVHRVGRTGRAGKFGESISYFTRSDWAQAKELINIMEEAQQYIPEELYEMADRFEKRQKQRDSLGGRRGGRFQGGGRKW
ncbi:hypothetical protein WA026_017563 [Henosepilachna vigintioctopunctata]|uniref:RNA helicase n=1 Tax=Henosepilachna vigintioctopunctata TaxID=420089 RepID=A0AAW1V1L1_9CUCU